MSFLSENIPIFVVSREVFVNCCARTSRSRKLSIREWGGTLIMLSVQDIPWESSMFMAMNMLLPMHFNMYAFLNPSPQTFFGLSSKLKLGCSGIWIDEGLRKWSQIGAYRWRWTFRGPQISFRWLSHTYSLSHHSFQPKNYFTWSGIVATLLALQQQLDDFSRILTFRHRWCRER